MRIRSVMPAIAALLAAAPALASDYAWQLRDAADGTVLAYEVPETDDQPISFYCNPQGRVFAVTYRPGSDYLRQGWKGEVSFRSEGGDVNAAMKVEEDELYGMTLTGEERFTAAWRDMLADGGTLTISFNGKTDSFPLKDAGKGAAALMRACGG